MPQLNCQPVCRNPIRSGVHSAEGGYTLCINCVDAAGGPAWHRTEDFPITQRAEAIEATPANIAKAVARCVFDRRGNHSEAHLSENELAAIIAEAVKLYQLKGAR